MRLGTIELRVPSELRRGHGRTGDRAFINADRLARDVARINDAARGKWMSIIGMALAAARNYDPFQAPTHFKLAD